MKPKPEIRGDSDVYLAALTWLPEDYPERQNIAALCGYLAVVGQNVSAIARAMQRSRTWVYRRLPEVKRIFGPLLRGAGLRDSG